MLEIALVIVNSSFNGKLDKGGKPYANHCIRVMNSIIKDHSHINNDIRCIALLHDLLEDCPEWNEKSLGCFFNKNIIDAINILTRKENQTYDDYIDEISKNSDATLVKIHDLRDNMDITRLTELTDKDCERLKKYHKAYLKLIN